jgi:peptidyl-tRNA hydrolase ICT1
MIKKMISIKMFLRLSRFFSATVTRDKLIINFSRSQGPGGQNVNKVNSKADVRFHVDSADWISPEVRERLKTSYAHFINKEGELIVQSQSKL